MQYQSNKQKPNPIKFIDPSGKELVVTGDYRDAAIKQLESVLRTITLIDDKETHKLSYKSNDDLNRKDLYSGIIKEIIENKDIKVQIVAQNTSDLLNGDYSYGGSFLGVTYNQETETAETTQVVIPFILDKIDEATGITGATLMHEITESYVAGFKSLEIKDGINASSLDPETYNEVHNSALIKQPFRGLKYYNLDASGRKVPVGSPDAYRIVFYLLKSPLYIDEQILFTRKIER